MGVYDQAQSPRVAQRSGLEQPGIRLVYLDELPEIAYKGQIIYNGTNDYLLVYDGVAWQTIGDQSGSRLFVQAADPALTPQNAVTDGDQWFNTSTGILLVWDGFGWAEPVIPEDAVGEDQLAEDSITGKHTIMGSVIIGTNFFTADPNEFDTYMQIIQDANGGNIYFHYGLGEAYKGFLNPQADGSRPKVTMSSGTMSSDSSHAAQIRLYGAFAGGAGKKIELNADTYMNGNLLSTSSRRYKDDIVDLPYTREEILSLRPVEYTFIQTGERNVGFIAEEAEEAGLHRFVIKVDGQTEAFNYPAYTAALQKVCIDQQAQIDDLERRLSQLEG